MKRETDMKKQESDSAKSSLRRRVQARVLAEPFNLALVSGGAGTGTVETTDNLTGGDITSTGGDGDAV